MYACKCHKYFSTIKNVLYYTSVYSAVADPEIAREGGSKAKMFEATPTFCYPYTKGSCAIFSCLPSVSTSYG